MSNVQVPDVQVKVTVAGGDIARFDFSRVSLSPQEWDITAALNDVNSRQAVRACLLAAVAELSADGWEAYSFDVEGAGSTDDQPQLPWE